MRDYFFATLLVFAVGFLPVVSHAEREQEGHGGGGWDCGINEPIELVDFYEATYPGEVVSNTLNIVRSSKDVHEQVDEALKRIATVNRSFARKIQEAYKTILETKTIAIPESISPPDDLDNDIIKPLCRLVGLAKYNDKRNRILIDEVLMSRMPKTDQAGLFLHEAIYKVLRDREGATSSLEARRAVGLVFSDLSSKEFKLNLISKVSGVTTDFNVNIKVSFNNDDVPSHCKIDEQVTVGLSGQSGSDNIIYLENNVMKTTKVSSLCDALVVRSKFIIRAFKTKGLSKKAALSKCFASIPKSLTVEVSNQSGEIVIKRESSIAFFDYSMVPMSTSRSELRFDINKFIY